MEQETPQQFLEGAKTGIDIARKTGMLKWIGSLVVSRKSGAHSLGQVDYRERAAQALQENAVETLATLELTAEEAIKILEPGFSLDDLDKVHATWQKHWTEGASNVGTDDDERRSWWARLLAGEIQQPGTFSLRTLAVMETLSTKEGELFTQVCQYVWGLPSSPSAAFVNPAVSSHNPVLILPREESSFWKPSFEESAMLENAGLVKFVSNEVSYVPSADGPRDGAVLLAHDIACFLINVTPGSHGLRCGNLMLTDAGKEIYRLTTPDYSQSYRDEIVAEWGQRYKVLNVSHTS